MVVEGEYERMRAEHHATMRVLALLVEKFLEATGGDIVELDESAVLHAPDLKAFVDQSRWVIGLKVSR